MVNHSNGNIHGFYVNRWRKEFEDYIATWDLRTRSNGDGSSGAAYMTPPDECRDLLRCPFCGGKAYQGGEFVNGFFVSCNKCGCSTMNFDGSYNEKSKHACIKQAIAIWNHRAPHADIVRALEALKYTPDYDKIGDSKVRIHVNVAIDKAISILSQHQPTTGFSSGGHGAPGENQEDTRLQVAREALRLANVELSHLKHQIKFREGGSVDMAWSAVKEALAAIADKG